MQYIIYSTIGQSIASISDLGVHIYLDALVLYIDYRPPYRTICIAYLVVALPP